MSNPESQSSSARTVVLNASVRAEAGDTLADLARAAGTAAAGEDVVGHALALAAAWGPRLPRPGHGRTAELWSALATLGAVDLTVARAVEPHLDALTILAEAHGAGQHAPAGATWGVYAAESPTQRLTAVEAGDSWVLDGHKAWCSLAGRVSHALVTAWVDDSTRRLFAVDLASHGVRPVPAQGTWVSHGLPEITSCGVDFDEVDGDPVGDPGWYLTRPGFAWGGVGVAAVWFGGAVAVGRRVLRHVAERAPDQIAHLHVGRLDLALSASREALEAAAGAADSAQDEPASSALEAVRARSVVARTVETGIQVADHAMGPAPLAHDAEHAQRISDLRLYVRQHHAERDVADLGDRVLRSTRTRAPW
jgi:alkylation response protein AidB-like acyl-CoA dehydrogenase